MKFYVLERGERIPKHLIEESRGSLVAFLKYNDWNDYGYYTTFTFGIYSSEGDALYSDTINIGFKSQNVGVKTIDVIPRFFEFLDGRFFSIGSGVDYYKDLIELERDFSILSALNDVVVCPNVFDENEDEDVLNKSLLRGKSRNKVKEVYYRAYQGLPELTDFKFVFTCLGDRKESTFDIEFDVIKNSKPPSNVHAIIGRNGVGKTTIFNRMVESIMLKDNGAKGRFYKLSSKSFFVEIKEDLPVDYFSRIISVSFGAFDTFRHPEDNDHPAKGPCFTYLGLIDRNNNRLKSQPDIYRDFSSSISNVLYNQEKRNQWDFIKSIICAGCNFDGINLNKFAEIFEECGGAEVALIEPDEFEKKYFKNMSEFLKLFSSGHFIVLRILIDLLDRVESKTLVLIDEPETHLHPPLLSALIRAISTLLNLRNAVAIVATHSPVVLQEIPKSCVWKIFRTGDAFNVSRPKIETYGENISTLTEEVFALDINKSGFIVELEQAVSQGGSFDEILKSFNGQLGTEGRFILKALIANRGDGQ